MSGHLLEVEDLKTSFYTDDGIIPAVDGVDLAIDSGMTFGLVGESGCGKSVTSLSLLRLVGGSGKIAAKKLQFEGEDLLTLNDEEMRRIRGRKISMIFQEPMTALTPVYTVGHQIMEAIMLHQTVTKEQAYERTLKMLDRVGISTPEKRAGAYPHQLSGGMQQRVMIAMALSCNPKLLIADEPTTALDVTMQAQILSLIDAMQKEMGMAILLITHDLGVVAENADEIAIMYLGKIVERAKTTEIFAFPLHPYTKGLLQSIPRLDQDVPELFTIRGNVPNPKDKPRGCGFYNRCDFAMDICQHQEPELLNRGGHWVRCWKEAR